MFSFVESEEHIRFDNRSLSGSVFGNIVLKIFIEPLIEQIELRGQTNEKNVTLK
jgi:hypothetical protein